MENASTNQPASQPSLFDLAAQKRFETRLCDFARAVALRHRRAGGLLADFDRALVGYYAAWQASSRQPIPPLDARACAIARRTYAAVGRQRAAAKPAA